MAAIEFGMIMPFMAMLWLGTTELTFAYSSDRRIVKATDMVADLVARQLSVDKQVVEGIFQGAVAMAYPDGQGTSMKMVVSSVFVDEKGKTTVEGSEGHNRSRHPIGKPLDEGTDLLAKGEPGCVIVASVELRKPVLFLTAVFGHSHTLKHSFAHRPRSNACPEWT